MNKPIINILSDANRVPAQGVQSAYNVYKNCVIKQLSDHFVFRENDRRSGDLNHFWTPNPKYYYWIQKWNGQGINLIHAHFYSFKNNFAPLVAKVLNFYLHSFYASADYLLCVNPVMKKHLEQLCHYDLQKIHYVPNFLPTNYFQAFQKDELDIIKDKYNIKPGDRVILSIGQYNMVKDPFTFAKIAKAFPKHYKFVWIGGFSFPRYIIPKSRQIVHLVKGRYENLIFPGIVSPLAVKQWLAIADCFLSTSIWEGTPVSVLEVSSYKLPLILRDLEGYLALFKGAYLAANTVEDYVQQIKNLFYKKDLLKKMSEKSATIAKIYNEKVVAQQYKTLYKNLLRQKYEHKVQN